jgi:hypothetical protein
MESLPLLLTGESSFNLLRKRNAVYVDMTAHIAELILKGKYYFLSRPRWFGKSLTVSTFDELFSGERELFSGLYIEKFLDQEEFRKGLFCGWICLKSCQNTAMIYPLK